MEVSRNPAETPTQEAELVKKITIETYCPRCCENHEIEIDPAVIANATRFPVKYSYLHGDPRFILTLFIDRNYKVRAVEVSDLLEIHQVDLNKILTENKTNTLKDISPDQIYALVYMDSYGNVKQYYHEKYKSAFNLRLFIKLWKNYANFDEGDNLTEYFLKFPDYWIAGVRIDTSELNLVVSNKIDLDRLSTQLMFLFEKIASEI